MADSNTVVVIQCSKGTPPTLEVMSVEEALSRLQSGYYDPIRGFLVGASKPVNLDSYEGLIMIEGELSQVLPHEALAR